MKKTSNEEKTSLLKTELSALEKRLTELEKLIQADYEDKVRVAYPRAFALTCLTSTKLNVPKNLSAKRSFR